MTGDPVDRETHRLITLLAREPRNLQVRYDLAAHLWENGRFPVARDALATLISVAPDQPEANFMLGQLLLLQGHFSEGWARYAWRYRMDHARKLLPRISQPCWQGGSLAGKTLLVFGEQGFGDTVQFARFIPLLVARGEGRIAVGSSAPLRRILQTLPGEVPVVENIAAGPAFDWQVPVSALPGLVGADLTLLAALPVPYLWADPGESARWLAWRRRTIPTRFAIGVVWAGRPTHAHDHRRSLPWPLFAPLCRIDDVSVVSLQLPAPPPEVVAAGVIDVSADLTDFAATAAVMTALDLIITVDTAVAHLAGALGRPVWTIIARVPDWRWLLDRDDSPWYPTMRLFRQREGEDWPAVMARVVAALHDWMVTAIPVIAAPSPVAAATAATTDAASVVAPPIAPPAITAWLPTPATSAWRWPTGPFFPPHPPLRERVACRCCSAHAHWVAAIDLARCRADAAGMHLPLAGVPVDYHHCARCGCRFTEFFDHWHPDDLWRLAVDPLRILADPEGVPARQRLQALLAGRLIAGAGATTTRILVIDPEPPAWADFPGRERWQWSLCEPFRALPPPGTASGADFAAIVLVDAFARHPRPHALLDELVRRLAVGGVLLLGLDLVPEQSEQLIFPAYTPRNGSVLLHTSRSLRAVLRRHGLRWQQLEPGIHLGQR
ncbi:MAG: tetratricopeptide repeat protein [Magnetococcales bacterium]|nr:tetratricopeptide repeat protein [Magnetococcales bacterium]